MGKYQRNLFEFFALLFIAEVIVLVQQTNWLSTTAMYSWIVFFCWLKTAWFVYETSLDIRQVTLKNMPYHRFLRVVGINMIQIVLSFGLDFYLLLKVDITCFNGIDPKFTEPELLFECFYLSALNFSYFGYGDVTPANIPAKLVTLTGILLGFMTVIFILSDFVTLKESISATVDKKEDA
jgi:Ion channel